MYIGGWIMVIFINEFFELTAQNGKVFCKTMRSGFPLKDFDTILRDLPRIKLTNFAILKTALNSPSDEKIEIGNWLPGVGIEITRDKMTASLFIYETVDYVREHKEQLQTEIQQLLKDNNIVYGIIPLKLDTITPGKAILIAQGTPAIKGEDAKITYIEIPERKPVIREDGTADYYDMNFIFEISEGSWLGEKIPPQQGTNGYNVHGDVLQASPGRDYPLRYDMKSAYEIEEGGKIVLRSKISGVLEHNQGLISVNHHLPIQGDVGVETGNINFEGSISIRGTVGPGFSVIAKGDISIEGAEGVSAAKLIKSIEGDVYIRGGIFGGGETRVEAGGSIFVKHVNDAHLKARNEINIGFYSMGSNLSANKILLDERKGKLIGGKAIAKTLIVTAISGNRLERRTDLIIESVNKQEAYTIIQERAAQLKKLQEDIISLEEQVERLAGFTGTLNPQQLAAFEQAKVNLKVYKEEAVSADYEIKEMMQDLRNIGKEEISVTKEAHPGTYIQIGKKSSLLTKNTNGKFLLECGELNV